MTGWYNSSWRARFLEYRKEGDGWSHPLLLCDKTHRRRTMMSGDDRQNSPSISRQNRPSATVCPKTEGRIQIYKKRPAIWQDGSFFDHISFNWSIFGDGLFRVRADHTASHSQHRDRKQDCHGVYLLLSDFDATIRQVIVFVNKFFKVFIVKLHKCFVKTNKNRRCVLDTSPVRLYPFRMSVFRY